MTATFAAELLRFRSRRAIRIVGFAVPAATVFVVALEASGGEALDVGHLREALAVLGQIAVLVSAMVGATFVGAECASGSYAMFLTWEPRRTRVTVAQAGVAAAGCAAIALVACLVLTGGLHAASFWSNSSGSQTGEWWVHRGHDVVRIAIACGLAGAIGAAWAAITRSTVASTAAFLALALGGEHALAALASGPPRWGPATNLVRLGAGRETFLALDVTTVHALMVAVVWVVLSIEMAALAAHREVR